MKTLVTTYICPEVGCVDARVAWVSWVAWVCVDELASAVTEIEEEVGLVEGT